MLRAPVLLFGLICFFASPVRAASISAETWVALMNAFEERSLADGFRLLPPEVRKNSTFAYRSFSLHALRPATGQDPGELRGIVFDRNAGFVAAFAPSAKEVEIIEAGEQGRLEFSQVSREGNQFVLRRQKDLGHVCNKCHSIGIQNEPHFNWQAYSSWPGFVGSRNDIAEDGEEKLAKYLMENAEKLPFLNQLLDVKSNFSPDIEDGQFLGESNGSLTFAIFSRNAERVARLARTGLGDDYKALRSTILEALVCKYPVYLNTDDPEIAGKFPKDTIYAEFEFLNDDKKRNPLIGIAETAGVSTEGWSTNYLPTGAHPFRVNGNGAALLAHAFVRQDPELRAQFAVEIAKDKDFLIGPSSEVCERLAKESIVNLKIWKPGRPAVKLTGDRVLRQSCAVCHSKTPGIPVFPFESLEAWNAGKNEPLIEKIKASISPGAKVPMPYIGSLTEDERKALLELLDAK